MPQEILDRLELGPEHAPVAHQVHELNPQPGTHARLVANRTLAALAVNSADPNDKAARGKAHEQYVQAHTDVTIFEEQAFGGAPRHAGLLSIDK